MKYFFFLSYKHKTEEQDIVIDGSGDKIVESVKLVKKEKPKKKALPQKKKIKGKKYI